MSKTTEAAPVAVTTRRFLDTPRGRIDFPAYLPVTTWGPSYHLDDLVRPYLPRLAPAMLASYHYARQMPDGYVPPIPLWVDSGGFALLAVPGARLLEVGGLGVIELDGPEGVERIHPDDVLALQARVADVGFTLDFPIPPGLPEAAAIFRRRLTFANTAYASRHRPATGMKLYACVQAWDVESAVQMAQLYAHLHQGTLDGVALGGLVPRRRDVDYVLAMVRGVRAAIGDMPLHVLGLGGPDLVRQLYAAGADSVDSSGYVQAADGVEWARPGSKHGDLGPTERLRLALSNLGFAVTGALPAERCPPDAARLLVGATAPRARR